MKNCRFSLGTHDREPDRPIEDINSSRANRASAANLHDYPSSPPHVGDYLTVYDVLPDPAPGTGRYYVTAATYQGQTRYGWKTTAGHLTGRDPAVLPACVPP